MYIHSTMKVIKRNGNTEPVSFDKVTNRIKALCEDLTTVDPIIIAQKVCSRIYDNVHTSELDELAAKICVSLITESLEYNILGTRIIISNNHKNTSPSFSEAMTILYNNIDIHGNHSSLLADDVYQIIMNNKEKLNNVIDYSRDYNFDYFGFKTLEKAYLFKINGKIIERIQHMFMRVSIGIHKDDISSAIESYNYMSQKYFIHATPTLYHSGTPRPQLLSCFIGTMQDDSIDGIYKTLGDCAKISKWAGGIGLAISNIRSKGSKIRGTNGISTGIIPMLRVYNNTAKYVNQCFASNALIYSKNGIKEARHIKIGDKLLTCDGSYKKVMEIFENYRDEEIIKYRIMASLFGIRCTKQHQIYILRPKDFMKVRDEIKNGITVPQYISAGEITTKDFAVFAIPDYVEDIDEEDLEYFFIYGVCLKYAKLDGDNITLELKNSNTIWRIRKFLEKRRIAHILNKNIFMWRLKDDIFYSNSGKIQHKFLHLPNSKTLNILSGIFKGDTTKRNVIFRDTLLVATIRYLALRLGFLLSGELKNGNYHIKYPRELDGKGSDKYFKYGKFIYSKIEKVKLVNYKGNVYDYNVEDNHNYTTDMGLVHNSGKRPGSFAMYIEPHHPDIFDFLDLKKNHGNEEERARDLFLALWISDLFMKRVENNEDWSLLDPDECPGLSDVYGEEYEKLYIKYEKEGRARKIIKARSLWRKILDSQIETGVPYISFKDHVNRKSNHKNLGTIKSSNLCVTGDTKILTKEGYIKIEELEGQNVEVWNGEEFSKTQVFKTGENQKILNIVFSNGMDLSCTPYHKFYIKIGKDIVTMEAKDLQKGMKLINFTLPTIDNNNNNYHIFDIDDKYLVPPNSSLTVRLKWLSFLCDTNLVSCENNNLIIYHKSKEFLKEVFLMLQTMNIKSSINDHRLFITSYEVTKLLRMGLKPQKLKINIDNYGKYDYHDVFIEQIIDNNVYDKTFCFNEEKRHMGMFNGILTGQCNEINEYFDEKETACCTLASISLSTFVDDDRKFNYNRLVDVVRVAINNLNKIIDLNFYPIPETERSNKRHRPLGLGVQGLADVFFKMKIPFDSLEAQEVNKNIFEAMYYGAVKASCELAKNYGSYETFEGSPMSQGIFQFDMWNVKPSDLWDWKSLKENVMNYGVRNSLLIALMPTASTAQILGNTECFECITSNIYKRETIAGSFVIVNKYLIKDLMTLGIWNRELKDIIIAHNGSIQNINGIPDKIKDLYKTVWEIKQKAVVDLAIGRGPFICQTQSMNLFFEEPTHRILTNALFYGWKGGLKTGSYYIRSRPKIQAQQFTIDPNLLKKNKNTETLICSLENPQNCEMCGA